MTSDLDVRTVAPRQRHAQIFQRFDRLGPGECFTLVNDHEPKELLQQFLSERPGAFDWSVLQAGPECFRVEIGRRTETGPRTVSEALGWDHDRLDRIMEDVERLVGSGDVWEAATRFAEFRCGLERHIDMEQRIVFPAFEKHTGMVGGPVTVMTSEHEDIRQLLGAVADALAGEDTVGFLSSSAELKELLEFHNVKEEEVFYPMTDQALGEKERDALVREMQSI
jgi:uncharacterized protein (DUF2249 family)/hemerythrin-like domain-containing protein